MNILSEHLLSLILFLPLVGAVVLLAFPAAKVKAIRCVALVASLIPLALTLVLWGSYRAALTVGEFKFVEN